MRAEDIVGWGFFLVLFFGIGKILFAFRMPQGSQERKAAQGSGLLAMGAALLVFGVATFWLVRASARPVVEGNIWGVSEPIRYSSAVFRLTDSSGKATTLRCRYNGPGLREGDRARVRYVEYNQKVVEFTMLTGSYAGWHFEEPSGERSFLPWTLIGLACGYAGFRLRGKRTA